MGSQLLLSSSGLSPVRPFHIFVHSSDLLAMQFSHFYWYHLERPRAMRNLFMAGVVMQAASCGCGDYFGYSAAGDVGGVDDAVAYYPSVRVCFFGFGFGFLAWVGVATLIFNHLNGARGY
jgi:hypothetical protein